MKDVGGHGRDPDHGHASNGIISKTYVSWSTMIQRCYNQKSDQYPYYGGRGIRVYFHWHKFKNFLKDMGERPLGMTLGRIDNEGNYRPGNCRWETHREQCENRRSTHWVTYQGQEMTLITFARTIGISEKALYNRVSQGWSLDQIINHYSDSSNWTKRRQF